MFADWADFWCGFARVNIATVTAFPNRDTIFLENDAFVEIGEQLEVALLVFFFDFANFLEQGGDFFKAFFASFFGELGIHVGVFVVFAVGSSLEIGGGVVYAAAMQKLVPNFGMLFFVVAGFLEDGRDLLVALFLSLTSEKLILYTSLCLASKSSIEVRFGFCAL